MKRIFTAFLCLFAMVGMAQNIVFQETFNGNLHQGGNDNNFTSGSGTEVFDNEGITTNKAVYGASKCIRIGKSHKKSQGVITAAGSGSITLPQITLEREGKLSFRAAGWGANDDVKDISVTITTNGTPLTYNKTLQQSAWQDYEIPLSIGNIVITIGTSSEEKNRFFLDDVVVKTAPANLNITIGSALYTTFFTDKAYTMPEGLTGNTVTVSGTTAMLTPSYPAGSSVPANTPLLISGTQGDHNATILSGAVAPVSATNLLKGTLTAETKAAPEGGKVYIFAQDPEGLGFYWQNGTNGTTVHNAAGKCYLEVPAGGAGVQGFRLDDALTPIEAVATDKAEDSVYDLSGRRVSNAGRGLYIVNGKKVIR